MTIEFKEGDAKDFMTFSKEPPPHSLMEGHIIEIGGGGKRGVDFKHKVLKMAGWKHHALTSYGAYADDAVVAFNRLRIVLSKTNDKNEILNRLSSLSTNES